MAWLASTTPRSTSLALCSTIRATKGNALMTSGTIAASEPMARPTISLVSGVTKNSNITNGMLRRKLTTAPSTMFSARMGCMPSLAVTTRTRPSGSPIT